MPREWRLRIQDILDSIDKIERHIAGMDYAEFAGDEKTLDGIERNITTIGEAAGRIPEDLRKSNPDVPWPEMRSMRNVATHRYFGMDTKTVWRTAKHNLPPLIPKLRRILESEA